MARHKKKPKNELKISSIVEDLEKQEKKHDLVIANSRPLVRNCANAIKCLHYGDVQAAKNELETLEKGLKKLPKIGDKDSHGMLEHIYQEAVEAKLLMAAIEHWPLPDYKKLKVTPQIYLLGLCDLIGELRRQMLEQLKQGDGKEAKYFFELMEDIYEQLSVIKFSNSLLPNFKRKQDVARIQLEQARSEILRVF
jgi:translin